PHQAIVVDRHQHVGLGLAGGDVAQLGRVPVVERMVEGRVGLVGEATHGLDVVVADLADVHGKRLARARSASAPVRRLAATTPSTRSAATADRARPRTWTATTAVPSPRPRSVRTLPPTQGGVREPGTARPRARARWPRRRAR